MGNPHRRGTKKTAAKKKKAKPSPVPLDPADPTENNPAQITSTTENKCEENAKMAGPTGSPEKRRLLTTDGVIAAFTVVIAVGTWVQWGVFSKQLDAMHIDQRAWVVMQRHGLAWDPPIENQFLSLTLPINNSGKTVALSVSGSIFIDVLPNDKRPDFSRTLGGIRLETGALPPNDPQPVKIYRLDKQTSGDDFNGIKLSKSEKEALDAKQDWIPIWGQITYWDVFGAQHFNKFCMWVPDYTPKPEMARECSRYNDVDH